MSETAQDIPFEEPDPAVADETPAEEEVGDNDQDGDDDLDGGDEPSEEDATAAAQAEREQELAAERQEEAQSIEAQAREQDAKRKKLDQLAGHVAKRYGEILGPDLDGWVGCPLCAQGYPGIRLPVMPDYETVAAVKVAIGEDPDPPLHDDPYSRQCEACGGRGTVKTNSYVSGETKVECIPCEGHGWIPIGPERQYGRVTTLTSAAFVPANGDTAPVPGEPAEAAALKALGWIVVPPLASPEITAAQGG